MGDGLPTLHALIGKPSGMELSRKMPMPRQAVCICMWGQGLGKDIIWPEILEVDREISYIYGREARHSNKHFLNTKSAFLKSGHKWYTNGSQYKLCVVLEGTGTCLLSLTSIPGLERRLRPGFRPGRLVASIETCHSMRQR